MRCAHGISVFRAWLFVLGSLTFAASARGGELPYEGEPIRYLSSPADDPVARLQRRLDRSEISLNFDGKRGYLESVLEALRVPPSSQVLVFSKTSFQRQRISPETPRALYFSDSVYVGWVQGGDVLEFSTVDPQQGAMFYLLPQKKEAKPVFQRQTHDCLQCHSSTKTQEVPGHLVRSVYPDGSGTPIFNAGTFVSSHESPLKERWGGWYVTGKHGAQRHMGNVFATDTNRPEVLDTEAGANVPGLSKLLDTSPYLRPSSDIVALLVLEHQTQMQNLIAAANFHTRLALHYEKGINEALGRSPDAISETTERRIHSAGEKLLRYLLFADEAPLTDRIEGSAEFARDFAARGRRDRLGRSLRDFDLERRLFRYPCSFLIDSEAFEKLPEPVKSHVLDRLHEVLSGRERGREFARISDTDRTAILQILLDTHPHLAQRWKER